MTKINNVNLEDELQSSYIDYAMSVIIGRAIPDARDGLKPAQRRILYAMSKINNTHNQPTKKSVRVVGETIGKYHPHGDIAVYDTMVRMAQNFSLNHILVEGQGNMGSVDGDPPAAMRYTEVRLTKLAEETLEDLDKNTVQMVPNFDNTEKEPSVLPGKVPNLLINGASGIAVGVATSMPSHNLNEVCDAIIFKLKNKEASVDDILKIIKGPDFPTGGIAIMSLNSYNGYRTGRGQLTIRGKVDIDTKKNRLIINEFPYNVNKASLIHTVANLVHDKKITGIRDIRDETGRTGMSVVIELKNGEDPNQILNQLYTHTQLQITFPIINLAVVGTSLKSLNVLNLIDVYITHRLEIILKRSIYELGIATDRLHIVEGLVIAIGNIDEIIKTIKKSEELADARKNLMEQFSLSEKQSNAILDMKLSRLTHLEGASLLKEKAELQTKILNYKSIIESKEKQEAIIIADMEELKKKFGRERRTEIIQSDEPLNIKDEDMISNEKVSIILTKEGYVKRLPLVTYREQARGGRGIISINLKEGDFVSKILTCNNKDYILFITDAGRAYWLKAYVVPESGRYAEGKAIVNLLNLTNEKVVSMLNTNEFANSKIVFLTAKGLVKKTDAMLFSKPRSSGIRAITLNDDDKIAASIIFKDEKYLLIATKNGKSIKFNQSTLRLTGRGSMGVRGIKLKNDEAMNIIAANDSGSVLTITEKGYGKITDIALYRMQSRSGSGVINLKVNDKTGSVIKALFVKGNENLIMISSTGITITIPVSSIRVTGRAASGVRLMRLDDSSVVSDARILAGQEQSSTESINEIQKQNQQEKNAAEQLEIEQDSDLDKQDDTEDSPEEDQREDIDK
jgi:DNA gyrase subunit A